MGARRDPALTSSKSEVGASEKTGRKRQQASVSNCGKIRAQADHCLLFDPSVFLARLSNGKTSREYRPKETIFSQGDKADEVFFLRAGRVQLTIVSTRGKEAVLAILQGGSFFGEGCLAGQPLRMATATAVQRADVVAVARDPMVKL